MTSRPRPRALRPVFAVLVALALALPVVGAPAPVRAEPPDRPHATGGSAAADPRSAVIPKPRSWSGDDGELRLGGTVRLAVDRATARERSAGPAPGAGAPAGPGTLHDVARAAARDLADATGVRAPVSLGGTRGADVVVALDRGPGTGPGTESGEQPGADESYRLEIGRQVRLTAPTATGVYYGTRTLIQLLRASADGRTLPTGTLVDGPDTEIRMNTVDVSREYWEPREIADVIRQMGYLKQNFLVLHLDDAEGFRLDSPRYPGLAEPGYSYDRATIRRLDRLAQRHGVQLVPGFEFPAHVSPKSAYFHVGMADGPRDAEPGFGERDTGATPQNSCTGYSYSHLTDDFTFNVMNQRALRVSQEMLDEFLPWFSAPWVHLGGDEIPPDLADCPALQAFVEESPRYSTVGDVAIDFLNTLNEQVTQAGRRSIIYDGSESDTVQVPLDRDVVIMDWTGDGTAPHMAPYDKIVASGDPFYLVPARDTRPDEEAIARSWAAPTDPTVLGWGMHVWGDDLGWAQGQWLESLSLRPRAVVADRQWHTTPRTADEFASFGARLDAVGAAPGYVGVRLPEPTRHGRPIHQYVMDPQFPPGTYDAHTPTSRRGLRDVCGLSGMTPLFVETRTVEVPGEGWTKEVDADGYWFGAPDVPGPWSLTARVRLTGSPVVWEDLAGTTSLSLGATGLVVTTAGESATVAADVPQDAWVDVAMVSDGSTVRLFVDGEEAGSVDSTAPLPRTRLRGPVGLAQLDLYAEALGAEQVQAAREGRPEPRCAR
ncbi:family 20 glycosylhydrolase [Isoptericola cucumis]|uniref:family 20 glycosylhydrolase n=1 Tax=Isoptericola cucumis TaxID=1776856 RepID=UPI00166F45AF|nr:family 20 glycosylhydrolase [Isoptericola cucumis]